MEIFIRPPTGNRIILQVEPTETIAEVKSKISGQHPELPHDQFELLFAGKALNSFEFDGKRLVDYNIQKECTLHLIFRHVAVLLPTDDSARESREAWATKARKFDFDDDFHIVDPQSHFHLLKKLEDEVFQSSEFAQEASSYNASTSMQVHCISGNLVFPQSIVPEELEEKVKRNISVYMVSAFNLPYDWYLHNLEEAPLAQLGSTITGREGARESA